MNWEAIGAIGEILSAVSVLVTLVYLATRVREAKHQMALSAQQTRDATFRDLYLEQMRNTNLVALLVRANKAWNPNIRSFSELAAKANLSEEGLYVLRAHHIVWWTCRLEPIANIEHMSEVQIHSFNVGIRNNYGRGHGKPFYESLQRSSKNEQVYAYIDSVLGEGSDA